MKEWSFGIHKRDLANWPKKEDGEPVAPAFLERVSPLSLTADVEINLLEAYGIPVIPHYPHDGTLGKVVIGMPGAGVDLFVPETLLEDARNILSGDIASEESEDEQN